MRHKVTHRINRHLDEQLGMWTRLLPWRREIAVHIEEIYQAARAEAPESEVDDVSWQRALADFGDVQDVASQLRKEHWPQYVGWRIVAVVVSAWIVVSIVNPRALLSLPALCFTVAPLIAFVAFDACRGSTRWELAGRVGTWGALCGAIFGTAALLGGMADPSNVGSCLAVSMLSVLYCVLFFTPRRSIVVAMISIVVVDMGLLVAPSYDFAAIDSATAFGSFLREIWGGIDGSFVMRVLAICGAGVCAGIARFGFHGVARHAFSIGTGTFLISLMALLTDLGDPGNLIPHFLVAVVAMAIAVICSYCISDSSRLVRHILN